jgi:hypothetical protein
MSAVQLGQILPLPLDRLRSGSTKRERPDPATAPGLHWQSDPLLADLAECAFALGAGWAEARATGAAAGSH